MTRFQNPKHFIIDQNGAGAVTGLLTLLISMMLGGLAVDYANSIRTRAQLQAVADSAAMAGAMWLPLQETEVRQSALSIASLYGAQLLKEADVEIGYWNAGRFEEPSFHPPNAVKVTTRRSDENLNPVDAMLLRVVGVDRFNIFASSVAVRKRSQPNCSGGGYFAKGMISAHSSNTYSSGFCLHGNQAIHLYNRNIFEPGTVVSTPDIRNVFEHRNNVGLAESLRPGSAPFSRTQELPDLLSMIRTEGIIGGALPSYITQGPEYLSAINASNILHPNTLYIVDGDVTLRGNRRFEQVAILANGQIRVQSNVELRDVVLATEASISLSSNTQVGGNEADYCSVDAYSSYLLAAQNISIGSNNALRGVMMAAIGDISMESNNEATQGVYAEAGGNITYQSAATKQGCAEGYDNQLRYADWAFALVK